MELPHILGRDAVGIIHEVPEGPAENLGFKPGDRVVYGPFNTGSYAGTSLFLFCFLSPQISQW